VHRSLAAALFVSMSTLLQATAIPVSAQEAPFCRPGEAPQFTFGFATLKAQLGAAMGEPIECAHPNDANGDVLQQTTAGLSFWRKSTNTPTFTNGWEHWGLTPGGAAYWTGESIDPPGVAAAAPPAPPRPAPTASAPPAPAPSAERPRRIGEATVLTAPSGVRLLVTVNAVEDNARPGRYDRSAEGRYMVVDWTIKNDGGVDVSVNRLHFKLQTGDGFIVERALTTIREPDLQTATIGPGQTVRGWLTYDVPKGATVAAAIYQPFGARQFVIAQLP
jgi:hypothetical protein